MKKIALLLVFAMLLSLAACAGKKAKADTAENTDAEKAEKADEPTETVPEPELPSEPAAQVCGGWSYDCAVGAPLDGELSDIFSQATGELLGATHEPVALIGTQVVAGINYAFLCRTTLVTRDPVVKLTVAIVNKDLEGTVTLLSINDLDPVDYTAAEYADGLVGGWTAAEPAEGLPAEAETETFETAVSALTGVSYRPMALLGSQVVAGVNYLYLASATAVVPDAVPTLKLVSVYRDLSGSCTVTAVEDFNVADFTI